MQDCYLAKSKGRGSLLNGPVKIRMAITPDGITTPSIYVVHITYTLLPIRYIILY